MDYFCIDIGATYLRFARIDEFTNLIKVETLTSELLLSIDILVEEICENYFRIINDTQSIAAISIAIPGPVTKDGICSFTNLSINNVHLASILESKLHKKVFTNNDANLAAYAEAMLGNGKGHQIVQYITLSSGVGGGLIIHGEMIKGKFGFAQELGNMILQPNGMKLFPKLNQGSFETMCSGNSLIRQAKNNGLTVHHCGELFENYEKDALTTIILDQWLHNLAIGVANIIHYMEPDVILLGGGLMKSSEYFLPKLNMILQSYLMEGLRGKMKVMKAKYDQDACLLGCALVAKKGETYESTTN